DHSADLESSEPQRGAPDGAPLASGRLAPLVRRDAGGAGGHGDRSGRSQAAVRGDPEGADRVRTVREVVEVLAVAADRLVERVAGRAQARGRAARVEERQAAVLTDREAGDRAGPRVGRVRPAAV